MPRALNITGNAAVTSNGTLAGFSGSPIASISSEALRFSLPRSRWHSGEPPRHSSALNPSMVWSSSSSRSVDARRPDDRRALGAHTRRLRRRSKRGSVYVILARMEEKGFLDSRQEERAPGAQRAAAAVLPRDDSTGASMARLATRLRMSVSRWPGSVSCSSRQPSSRIRPARRAASTPSDLSALRPRPTLAAAEPGRLPPPCD